MRKFFIIKGTKVDNLILNLSYYFFILLSVISNRFLYAYCFLISCFLSKNFEIKINYEGFNICISRDPYWLRLLSKNFYYEDELKYFFTNVKFNSKFTFIDLGSNIGFWSCFVLFHSLTNKTISVEPNSNLTSILHRNLSNNSNSYFEIIDKAIWTDSNISLELFTPTHFGGNSDSTLIKSFSNSRLKSKKVLTISIKDIFSNFKKMDELYIIKMDVEGVEMLILDQILDLLRYKIIVIFESHGKNYNDEIFHLILKFPMPLYFLTSVGLIPISKIEDINFYKKNSKIGYNFLVNFSDLDLRHLIR